MGQLGLGGAALAFERLQPRRLVEHGLALLLERIDDLPLRRHEIRGNPAGLLARLLARIDGLKAERVGPTSLAELALSYEVIVVDDGSTDATADLALMLMLMVVPDLRG